MTTLLLIIKTNTLQDYNSVSATLLTIRAESLFDHGILSFELFRSVIDPLAWYVKEKWENENHLLAHLSRLSHSGSLHQIYQFLSRPLEVIKVTKV